MARVDDREIYQLEQIRRHGSSEDFERDEAVYYKFPAKRDGLLQEWTAWRVRVNSKLILRYRYPDAMDKTTSDLLTVPPDMKIPRFFRGANSFYGRKTKDRYGTAIDAEADNEDDRLRMEIVDENFYLFGIPRASLKSFHSRKSRRVSVDRESGHNLSDFRTTDKEELARSNRPVSPNKSKYKYFGNRLPRIPIYEEDVEDDRDIADETTPWNFPRRSRRSTKTRPERERN